MVNRIHTRHQKLSATESLDVQILNIYVQMSVYNDKEETDRKTERFI